MIAPRGTSTRPRSITLPAPGSVQSQEGGGSGGWWYPAPVRTVGSTSIWRPKLSLLSRATGTSGESRAKIAKNGQNTPSQLSLRGFTLVNTLVNSTNSVNANAFGSLRSAATMKREGTPCGSHRARARREWMADFAMDRHREWRHCASSKNAYLVPVARFQTR
jgi:hypothetical protein